jgi:hypothetical protein
VELWPLWPIERSAWLAAAFFGIARHVASPSSCAFGFPHAIIATWSSCETTCCVLALTVSMTINKAARSARKKDPGAIKPRDRAASSEWSPP